MSNTSAKALYTSLEAQRQTYLDRARDCSKITLPYLIPPSGFGKSSRLETPWQSVGSRGVNNLAAKLLLALLPPNAPFFRLALDEYNIKQTEEVDTETIVEIEKSLQKIEEASMLEVAKGKFRTHVFEALKHLIVAGNVCLYMPQTGLRVFHLDRFVVQRDAMGNVLTVIAYEDLARSTLSQELLDLVGAPSSDHEKTVPLHTIQRRLNDKEVEVWQEIDGKVVPDSYGTFPVDESLFIPLRFNLIDGEDYGRGLCEEYLGDLESLEALTKAIREGAAAAAKVLFLVKNNGMTSQKVLAESPNGAIVNGDADDVTTLQLDKFADFRVALEEKKAIEERLNAVFLLGQGLVRHAERVTAEEIRMLQQELETQHGGLYTLLAAEGQLPMANRLLANMAKNKKLPKLPKEFVEPVIITGVEALGRGNDLAKLDAFVAGANSVFGPEVTSAYIKAGEYFNRRAVALSIKTDGLLKSEEEVQAERQRAEQQAMVAKLGPSVVGAGAKVLTDDANGVTPSA
jgi:hypothetical protein